MKLNAFLIVLIFSFVFFGCGNDKDETSVPAGNHKVTVLETAQANAYTYLLVEENGKEQWIAIRKDENIKEEDVLYYKDAMEMKNFQSKDLNKTFDSVLFVQEVSDKPIGAEMPAGSPHQNIKPDAKENIDIKPAAGGITIAELFDNAESYSGKKVKVRGQIVKVNKHIMNKNWYHIQDGTGGDANYDLTITSTEDLEKGNVVTFEGTVNLDKDFGSGYKYDIIIEEAKVM